MACKQRASADGHAFAIINQDLNIVFQHHLTPTCVIPTITRRRNVAWRWTVVPFKARAFCAVSVCRLGYKRCKSGTQW